MIVTIHQPEHLPWLGFFDKMRQADIFVLLDSTQFAKEDFQNRNRIKTRAGAVWLTVPIFKKGRSKQLITEAEIVSHPKWRRRCWSLMHQSYKDASYFDEHRTFFQDLYARDWSKLIDINIVVIEYLVEQLGLKTQLMRSSELGIHKQDSSRVLFNICQELRAEKYLSGKHGQDYLDETPFINQGIGVEYQDFHHPTYPQLWGEFIPYMSVVDLLFNCGPSSLKIIVEANLKIDREGEPVGRA